MSKAPMASLPPMLLDPDALSETELTVKQVVEAFSPRSTQSRKVKEEEKERKRKEEEERQRDIKVLKDNFQRMEDRLQPLNEQRKEMNEIMESLRNRVEDKFAARRKKEERDYDWLREQQKMLQEQQKRLQEQQRGM